MSTTEKPQKISIGFVGGQVLSARVAAVELRQLRDALEASGWHDLISEDGTVAIDLAKVVYVQVDCEGHRVVFGS